MLRAGTRYHRVGRAEHIRNKRTAAEAAEDEAAEAGDEAGMDAGTEVAVLGETTAAERSARARAQAIDLDDDSGPRPPREDDSLRGATWRAKGGRRAGGKSSTWDACSAPASNKVIQLKIEDVWTRARSDARCAPQGSWLSVDARHDAPRPARLVLLLLSLPRQSRRGPPLQRVPPGKQPRDEEAGPEQAQHLQPAQPYLSYSVSD